MGNNEHRKASPEHQKADPAERTHLMQEVVELVAGCFGQQDEHEYLRLRSYLYHDVFQHLQEDPECVFGLHRFRKRQVNNEGPSGSTSDVTKIYSCRKPNRSGLNLRKPERTAIKWSTSGWKTSILSHSIQSQGRRNRVTNLFDLSLTLPFVAPGAHKNVRLGAFNGKRGILTVQFNYGLNGTTAQHLRPLARPAIEHSRSI